MNTVTFTGSLNLEKWNNTVWREGLIHNLHVLDFLLPPIKNLTTHINAKHFKVKMYDSFSIKNATGKTPRALFKIYIHPKHRNIKVALHSNDTTSY